MKKSLFMILEYRKRPNKEADTRIKGWKENNLDVYERVYFVDRISDKILLESHTVIDVFNRECIRTRFEDIEKNELVDKLITKHSNEVEKAIQRYFSKQ